MKQGDIRGLEPLVRAYYFPAVRAAYLITHDRSLAEDVVQSQFIRAYERIDQFDAGRPFGPWFLRSVVNSATTLASRLERFVPFDAVDPSDDEAGWSARLSDPGPDPEALFARAESREEVWQALAKLSPEQRATVVMHYYLELMDDEVAGRLGIAPATVRWRLHAARKRLRTLLGGALPEGSGKP
jgi:RNA polymerase sigma-70 factor (ECF subfamily)